MAHAKSTGNPNDFILPDLGEGVHEAELIAWRVQVGQTVAEHDILAEMETDKALVEVPSPRAGTIATLHGTPGEILKVGNPLVTYVGEGAAASGGGGLPVTKLPAAQAAGGGGAGGRHDPESNGTHPAAHGAAADESESSDSYQRSEDDGTVVGRMTTMEAPAGKVLATPAVRRLARDLGVDINSLRGSGIAGRVTEKDVRAVAAGGGTAPRAVTAGTRARSHVNVAPSEPEEPHSGVVDDPRGVARAPTPAARPAARPAPAPATAQRAVPPRPTPAGQTDELTRIPFRGVRRTIANRLRESMDQAVHFNVMDEADVSALDTLRRKLAAASGEKLSFLPFVASAVCRVLADPRFRAMNATVDEKPEDPNYDAAIVQHRAVHLGIATDTESGLMVPVIRDCDALGVLEIGREISAIAAAARSRTIPRERLIGSTFTISNVGSHAGRFATPVINYPEVGILAVGRARQAPVVRGGGIFVGNLLPLSLACDHRVVDGATGALALARIIELLQEPEQVMAPARG